MLVISISLAADIFHNSSQNILIQFSNIFAKFTTYFDTLLKYFSKIKKSQKSQFLHFFENYFIFTFP